MKNKARDLPLKTMSLKEAQKESRQLLSESIDAEEPKNFHNNSLINYFTNAKRERQVTNQKYNSDLIRVKSRVGQALGQSSTSSLHRAIHRFLHTSKASVHGQGNHISLDKYLRMGNHNRSRFADEKAPFTSKISDEDMQACFADANVVAKLWDKMPWHVHSVTKRLSKSAQKNGLYSSFNTKDSKQDINALKKSITAISDSKGILDARSLLLEQSTAKRLTVKNVYLYSQAAERQLKEYRHSERPLNIAEKNSVPFLKQIANGTLNQHYRQYIKDNQLSKREQQRSPALIVADSTFKEIQSNVAHDPAIEKAYSNLSMELKHNFVVAHAHLYRKRYPYTLNENPLVGLATMQAHIDQHEMHVGPQVKIWSNRKEQQLACKIISHAKLTDYDSLNQHDRDVKYTEKRHSNNQSLNTSIAGTSNAEIERAAKRVKAKHQQIIERDADLSPAQAKRAGQVLKKASPLLREHKMHLTNGQQYRYRASNAQHHISSSINEHAPRTVGQQASHMQRVSNVTRNLMGSIHALSTLDDLQNRIKKQPTNTLEDIRHKRILKAVYRHERSASPTVMSIRPEDAHGRPEPKQKPRASKASLDNLAEHAEQSINRQKKDLADNDKKQDRVERHFKRSVGRSIGQRPKRSPHHDFEGPER